MSKEAKLVRGQVRQIVKVELPGILNQELGASVLKKLNDTMTGRLDNIEDFCRKNLSQQDERAKNILGYILNEVKVGISSQLHDMRIEMIAQREILFEKIGITDNLDALLTAKKAEVQERLTKQYVEQQQVAIKADEAKKEMAESAARAEQSQTATLEENQTQAGPSV